jgi:hypothetical protein
MHFAIDGEVIALRPDGTSDFDALASRKHDKRAQFYAFDLISGAGRCRHWIKIKNPTHPAYSRVRDFHQSLRSRRSV